VRVLDVGDEDSDHPRALTAAEVAGDPARPVVELVDCREHTLLPRLSDNSRAVQNPRHGRDRYASTFCDIANSNQLVSISGIDFATIQERTVRVKGSDSWCVRATNAPTAGTEPHLKKQQGAKASSAGGRSRVLPGHGTSSYADRDSGRFVSSPIRARTGASCQKGGGGGECTGRGVEEEVVARRGDNEQHEQR
jgi:hypothetical protein